MRSASGSTTGAGPDEVLDTFTAWASAKGLRLYPAQEDALISVLAGDHVIVNTPTGSGKSLVALGAHLAALAGARRSWYSAPIKALVSEKFFDLCARARDRQRRHADRRRLHQPGAPRSSAARPRYWPTWPCAMGETAPVDQVVMDEFHFYADPDRGWAWQVPLIELRRAQFVLMSATLGDVSRFVGGLRSAAPAGRPPSSPRPSARCPSTTAMPARLSTTPWPS